MVIRRRSRKDSNKKFYVHLVSDATGTTLLGVTRACLAQFDNIQPNQKFWPLIKTERKLDRVIKKITENPGPVIFTMVNPKMRKKLQKACDDLGVPSTPVLDPIIHNLSKYLNLPAKGVPGLQHTMDEAYFKRVEAIDYAMRFDDGKKMSGLKEADVILVGVSRTSKTPTSVFLARRGIKCANIPLVPSVEIEEEQLTLEKPLYVGLVASPKRLVHIRRNRLQVDERNNDKQSAHNYKFLESNQYLDEEKIEDEVKNARKLFGKHGWPIIDVSKRSVEETAAEILALLQKRQEKLESK